MIKVGVVGGGIYGTNLLNAFNMFENEGLCKLISLADVNEEVLQGKCEEYKIAGYRDYREMFANENLKAVAIATPDFLHREIAVTAAEAGLNILLEKPMDVTEAGCREIIETADKNNVFLEVDLHKRHDPAHVELARAVRQGKMGELEYGYCWVEDTIEVPVEWLRSWSEKSSPAWFIGIHAYDLMRWLVNREPVRVYATGVKKKLPALGFDTYDSLQAKIEFEDNISVTVDASWVIPRKFPSIINQGLKLVGTEGIWEIDSQNRGVERVLSEENKMVTPNNYFIRNDTNFVGEEKYSGYGIESIRAFIEHLNFLEKGGNPHQLEGQYASGYDGLQATRMSVAIHKSAKTGNIIEL